MQLVYECPKHGTSGCEITCKLVPVGVKNPSTPGLRGANLTPSDRAVRKANRVKLLAEFRTAAITVGCLARTSGAVEDLLDHAARSGSRLYYACCLTALGK